MTKFDTQLQYNAAIAALGKHFNDEMDGNVYITSSYIVEAKNAFLLANYLNGQDTMPREHVFQIIEDNVPNFYKEVAEIYENIDSITRQRLDAYKDYLNNQGVKIN